VERGFVWPGEAVLEEGGIWLAGLTTGQPEGETVAVAGGFEPMTGQPPASDWSRCCCSGDGTVEDAIDENTLDDDCACLLASWVMIM
jgi:hypothetical protein